MIIDLSSIDKIKGKKIINVYFNKFNKRYNRYDNIT